MIGFNLICASSLFHVSMVDASTKIDNKLPNTQITIIVKYDDNGKNFRLNIFTKHQFHSLLIFFKNIYVNGDLSTYLYTLVVFEIFFYFFQIKYIVTSNYSIDRLIDSPIFFSLHRYNQKFHIENETEKQSMVFFFRMRKLIIPHRQNSYKKNFCCYPIEKKFFSIIIDQKSNVTNFCFPSFFIFISIWNVFQFFFHMHHIQLSVNFFFCFCSCF